MLGDDLIRALYRVLFVCEAGTHCMIFFYYIQTSITSSGTFQTYGQLCFQTTHQDEIFPFLSST